MTKRNAFIEMLDTIGSALNVAAAVDNGRQVRSRDLKQLGIDPVQFSKIKR